jgi:hypothetical protein
VIPLRGENRKARVALPPGLPFISTLWLSLESPSGASTVAAAQAPAEEIALTSLVQERTFQPLNVILIIIDTLRPDYLGCYGYPHDTSPSIDALAADGLLFETALCHSPITGPSHTSLFSSRLPSETGVVNNGRSEIPKQVPLLAEMLRARGLRTGAAVSIAPLDHRWGFARGFGAYDDRLGNTWILRADTLLTRALDVLAGLEPPFCFWAHFSDPHEPYDAHGLVRRDVELVVDGRMLATLPASTYTPSFFDLDLPKRACEVELRSGHCFFVRNLSLRKRGGWRTPQIEPESSQKDSVTAFTATITAKGSRKARLVVNVNDAPITHPELWERYAREVAFADRHVGVLLDSLRARGLYDESLIVFVSDHGEALGCHNHGGHIQTLYECMMRVPLIIKPPRSFGVAPGQRRRDPAALADLVPTILETLGLAAPPQARGRSLWTPAAAGEPFIFLETHRPEARRNLYGLRGERYKVIWEPDEQYWEFYDLARDPDERENLYDPDEPLVRDWQARLLTYLGGLDMMATGEKEDVPLDERTAEMLRSLGY